MSEFDSDTPPPMVTSPKQGNEAPPPERKRGKGTFFFGAAVGCLLAVVGVGALVVIVALTRNGGHEIEFSTNKVAVIAIEGEILDARDVVEAIHRYSDNSLVKAIVIRIDSPGGAIAPSQEIYEEIRKTRRSSGKPFVASLDTVAASGGFYIAAACDEIVANPGSITGSIGVILQWMDVKDLINWAKMRPETITSGVMKDAGSPYRALTEDERQYFRRLVDQLHHQFVRAVTEGRKGRLSEAEVAALADGRIFTGEEAHALKLVDRLGNLDDAVHVAAKKAGIRGKPSMLYPRKKKPGLIDLLSDSETAESVIERVVTRRLPRFLYRW